MNLKDSDVKPTLENIVQTKQRMTDSEFVKISKFITSEYGIKLPDFKKTMVEGRLHKRLRITGVPSFKDYIDLVFGEQGDKELLEMIDAISTNKTDFFRESAHFDFLSNSLLPEFIANNQRKVKVWSAAASSGEEIYTLAIIFEEFASQMGYSRIDYSILGTDISVDKLRTAIAGIYKNDRIKDISQLLRDKYFLRSKDKSKKEVRLVASIRSKTKFQRQNLMDSHYNVEDNFDLIFCRNVLIYFDKETQERVINKLCTKLKVGGYFFLGHSESILGKNAPLKQIKPTVYRKY